ncbi:MAG: glycosyltransferase family 4 protein [Oscillospiraceae bacterium]|nr:glycosyltransferase family 4 protein [Oscillospiraceae bacterium]
MKKAILLANDTMFAYNLRRELLERLLKEGYDVTVIAQPLVHQEKLQFMGCRLAPVATGRRGKNPFADLRLFFHYLKILGKEKPDIVFTNNIKPNVYGGLACRLRRIRYMANVTGLGTPVENPGPMQRLTTFLYKMGVAGAECVFFQNTENLQFFRDRKMLSKRSRTHLLPGSGVNLQSHPVREYPAEGKLHFLFVARVMKEKGIDLFLAAARKFHSENVQFDVCGPCDDPHYLQVLHQEQEAGNVVYHGMQPDLNPFYEKCGCFLYPSYYPEGMSNVLLEAAASGRPAIAADRSGCRETVDDGVTGYIVPVNDEQAVLEAVEKFLALSWEQRRDMGLAARAKVEREFDRQLVVEAYMKEINA